MNDLDRLIIISEIKKLGHELGFVSIGITDGNIPNAKANLQQWLQNGYQGSMQYLQNRLKSTPFVIGQKTIISCALNYEPIINPNDPTKAYIARHALSQDYHILMKDLLQKFADKISSLVGKFEYHLSVDSSPLLEKPIAEKAGIGWQGKNSLIINHQCGSWLVLGELITDLTLPFDKPESTHCGSCENCIKSCPTKAIIAPNVLQAERCIAYLTIEHRDSIPIELRPLIGNRIYGCDECQYSCPHNQHKLTNPKWRINKEFINRNLVDLFAWTESEFLEKTKNTSIQRLGYERWLRNLAVAIGNMPKNIKALKILKLHENNPSELIREHVRWAINQQSHYKGFVE